MLYPSLCTTCRAAAARQRLLRLASQTNIPPSRPYATRPAQRAQKPSQERRQAQRAPESQQSPPHQTDEAPPMTPAEADIATLLHHALHPTHLLVRDISGGCGSMYAIDIASRAFRGRTMLQQQRMVNAALGAVMSGWHGVQLNTSVSEED